MISQPLTDLLQLLDLETLEDNLFRGESRDLGGKSVYGGQVIGQALVAASRTVDGAIPHSLHAYFLRPGDMEKAVIYEVDRVRDGRTFAARRVQAIQHGQPILSMIASFQKPEPGLEHQVEMPDVAPPEKLRDAHELRRGWLDSHPETTERHRQALLRDVAIEFRPVKPWNPLEPEKREPQQAIWLKTAGKLPDDPMLHLCMIAYASDFNLLSTALLPHGVSWFSRDMVVASIDHALWFHRPARADEWLLYVMDAPTSQGARGFSRGLIFDRTGRLCVSVTQESLMRKTT